METSGYAILKLQHRGRFRVLYSTETCFIYRRASLNSAALAIAGEATRAKQYAQTVTVSGSAGDSYSFGGWVKTGSVSLSNVSSQHEDDPTQSRIEKVTDLDGNETAYNYRGNSTWADLLTAAEPTAGRCGNNRNRGNGMPAMLRFLFCAGATGTEPESISSYCFF